MFTYIIQVLVPVTFTVEANSREDAKLRATTLKQYSMTSPDGERIDISEDAICSIELADD